VTDVLKRKLAAIISISADLSRRTESLWDELAKHEQDSQLTAYCTPAERAVLDAMAEFTDDDIEVLQTAAHNGLRQHDRFVSLADAELARREAAKCSG
jgi:hypothetical protein